MQKLLVPTDFSELARKAYPAAASLAEAHNARIQLVHQVESLPPTLYESVTAPIELDPT